MNGSFSDKIGNIRPNDDLMIFITGFYNVILFVKVKDVDNIKTANIYLFVYYFVYHT